MKSKLTMIILLLSYVVAVVAIAIAIVGVITSCKEPEPTWAGNWEWGHTPIRIVVDQDVGYDASLNLAIRTWNREAGCLLFTLGEPADIIISIGDDHEDVRGWTHGYAVAGRITRAEITLHGVTDIGMAYRVLLHELGRSLGLAGSGWPEPSASAMNNAIAGRDLGVILVTYADKTAVRKRYCTP